MKIPITCNGKKSLLGFSLVELIVAISILVFIVTIILANHSRFNSSILLSALAYDIGLSIREAQVYGLSVKQFDDDFLVGYGVRFSGADTFVIFADRDRSRSYNAGDSILSTYSLKRGHRIVRFCGVSSANEYCSNSPLPITHIDIAFTRPNPDAWITSNENAGTGYYSTAVITVGSPTGETRSIEVAATGQISVKNP